MARLLARLADRPTLALILIFVLLDAVALFCVWLLEIGVLESRFFRLGRDRGLIEMFEYGKFALIIYMLLHAFRITGEQIYRGLWILFAVMLADNAIGIHEEVGELLITYFDIPDFGLRRPKDVAEIMVFAALEGSACLYAAWCYLQSGPDGRRFAHTLAAVLGIFVFCALGLDAAGPYVVEELGEILSMTLIMAWIHTRYRKGFAS